MGREHTPIAHEIKNNISKVTIEPERPYGIYLPDWGSVVDTMTTFAKGSFSLSKEAVLREKEFRVSNSDSFQYNLYTDDELTILQNLYDTPASQPDALLNIAKEALHSKGRVALYYSPSLAQKMTDLYDVNESVFDAYNVHLGPALFGKGVSIESSGDIYLLTMHSRYEESGEKQLAKAVGKEQAALPRNVIIRFGREEGDVYPVDFIDVAERVNGNLDMQVSAHDIARAFSPEKWQKEYVLGGVEGLTVKMRPLDVYSRKRNGSVIEFRSQDASHEFRSFGLEMSMYDPALESRNYGKTYLIPPEKRVQAQHLAEKIASSFTPTSA